MGASKTEKTVKRIQAGLHSGEDWGILPLADDQDTSEQLHKRLKEELSDTKILELVGVWKADGREKRLELAFVAGIERAAAVYAGKEFGQGAVLWGKEGEGFVSIDPEENEVLEEYDQLSLTELKRALSSLLDPRFQLDSLRYSPQNHVSAMIYNDVEQPSEG